MNYDYDIHEENTSKFKIVILNFQKSYKQKKNPVYILRFKG